MSENIYNFLTDYSSIYVAKVVKITNEDLYDLAPAYYKREKSWSWNLVFNWRYLWNC